MLRALDIEIHDHIAAGLKVLDDFGAERTVEVSVDFGAFEEFTGFEFGKKLFTAQEMVVLAVDFTGAG
jgi:hypothetical protein